MGWLRGPRYDLLLIVGVLALAALMGGLGLVSGKLFTVVLLLDVWLLAYPHAAATYTRIAMDRESTRRHILLLTALPVLVFAATASVGAMGGAIGLNTLYFFWQTWHYSRQSYGISRAYGRKAFESPDQLATAVIFAFPVWGLLRRAAQGSNYFYSDALWMPQIPTLGSHAAGAVALGLFAYWLYRQMRHWRSQGTLRHLPHVLFVCSHVIITTTSYIVVEDITRGWLFINIWHNAQYHLFVWAANERRFAGGKNSDSRFLSWISQGHRPWAYMGVCVAVGGGFYFLLGHALDGVESELLPVVLTVHLSVNFHHYVVDSLIWKRRPQTRA